jgi:hypothetical protein
VRRLTFPGALLALAALLIAVPGASAAQRWGRDRGGRFRTRGRTSVATVRGTAWLTEDRCEGTLTRVTEGAVHVRDVQRGGKARLVRAGRRLLVAKRRR